MTTTVRVEGETLPLRIAVLAEGALAAWPAGRTELAVRPLSLEGTPTGPTRTLQIASARGMVTLEGFGRRAVLVTHGVCPGRGALKCLFAQVLAPDGSPIGSVVRRQITGWMYNFSSARDRNAFYFFYTTMYYGGGLEVLSLREDGSPTFAGLVDCPLEGAQATGLPVGGRRWAFLSGVGCGDGVDDPPQLVVQGGQRIGVRTLRAAEPLALDWLDDETLGVIFRFASGRPRFVAIDLTGSARAQPGVLRPGEPIPAPFTGRLNAFATLVDGEVLLQRRDYAGDRVGIDATVAHTPGLAVAAPNAAWTGSHFLVLFGQPGMRSMTAAVAAVGCADPRP